jgi:hypothetical protein
VLFLQLLVIAWVRHDDLRSSLHIRSRNRATTAETPAQTTVTDQSPRDLIALPVGAQHTANLHPADGLDILGCELIRRVGLHHFHGAVRP